MKVNFQWGAVIASDTEKSEIENTIKEGLTAHPPVTIPLDGIINIYLFPDEPKDLRILGAATDSNKKLLFRFSYSGFGSSITFDLSTIVSEQE
jgi:hypothetical protein